MYVLFPASPLLAFPLQSSGRLPFVSAMGWRARLDECASMCMHEGLSAKCSLACACCAVRVQ